MLLAARGARERDGGREPVSDPAEARRLRARARRIHLAALAAATAATVIAGLAAAGLR